MSNDLTKLINEVLELQKWIMEATDVTDIEEIRNTLSRLSIAAPILAKALLNKEGQLAVEKANFTLAFEAVEKLKTENARLREALEFYADKANWFWEKTESGKSLEVGALGVYKPGPGCNHPTTRLHPDNGERARAALEEKGRCVTT